MQHEQDDEEPLYTGPFCVIRPEGLSYIVAIEPPLRCGAGSPRTYASKHEAFGAARQLWCRFSLPLRDETDGKVGPRS